MTTFALPVSPRCLADTEITGLLMTPLAEITLPELPADIVLRDFALNLLITLALCGLLAVIYSKFGQALSNRRRFASNFAILGLTTMVIITIVKSSLALSLGLVGALSIVRFRAAIKDPEELAYLFVTIAVGLGLGAGQRVVTLVGFAFIVLAIGIRHLQSRGKWDSKSAFLTISRLGTEKIPLGQLNEILKSCCEGVDLKRFEEGKEACEAIYLVDFSNFEKLDEARRRLLDLDETLQVAYHDQSVH